MDTKNDIKNKINALIKEYFAVEERKFVPGETRIPLQFPSYGWEESVEAMDSILSTWVTMGRKVREFENSFADYMGVRHATMVNSGSTANLLALSVLSHPSVENHIVGGDEIITPAVTWSTTVFPIANVNAVPVFVDVDLDTFNINVDSVEEAITDKTKAIMPVHLLGNPADIEKIIKIAKENNLFVIEDTCESHGAEVNGKKAGSFGDIGTSSFFFSHHITTIEGGMLFTDNEDFYELSKAMRAHGWIRELKDKESIAERYRHIDDRFLFITPGFNVRPTDIQGAFGIHQIKKLEDIIKVKRNNANYLNKRLEEVSDYLILHKERDGTRHSWFGYPITVRENAVFTREDLTKFLEQNKIETRPIMSGDFTQQPASNLLAHRVVGNLKNAKYIHKNSFFIGNHIGIGEKEREFVADKIVKFIGEMT